MTGEEREANLYTFQQPSQISAYFTKNCIVRWFNVDCSLAEGLYSLNDEIAAEAPQGSGGAAPGPGPGPAGGCLSCDLTNQLSN